METPTRVEFPGGESYTQLRVRALAALEAIRARHRGETGGDRQPRWRPARDARRLPAHARRGDLPDRPELRRDQHRRLDRRQPARARSQRAANDDRSPTARLPAGARLRSAGRGHESRRALRAATATAWVSTTHVRASAATIPQAGASTRHERAGVWRAIAERRDIRRFRPDPLPDELVRRLLEAAHRAPSVGLMQPWRFIVVRDEQTKTAMQALAARERLVQADHFDERTRQYPRPQDRRHPRSTGQRLRLLRPRRRQRRGARPAHDPRHRPLQHLPRDREPLARRPRRRRRRRLGLLLPRTDDLRALLGLPEHVVPVAWLCLGYPDERPARPGLEAAGWERRRPLDELVHTERWGGDPAASNGATAPTTDMPGPRDRRCRTGRTTLAVTVRPGDPAAAMRIRDASDELVKPVGSLGGLETLLERWAIATGTLPPQPSRAPASSSSPPTTASPDTRVSLYPARVGAQVAAAAARGETAIGVLADALGAELVVADVGLEGAAVPELVDRRVADGSADITLGPALTQQQLRSRRSRLGITLATSLAERCDVLVLGEIGIGNTTVAAALLAALTGLAPEAVCGRGTGLDAQGLARKRATVAAALATNAPDPHDPLECLRRVGGLELAALVGALLAAAAAEAPRRARRVRRRRRRTRRLPPPASAARLPDRRTPIRRTRTPPRAHRTRPRAAARPTPAPRRSQRRSPRPPAHRPRLASSTTACAASTKHGSTVRNQERRSERDPPEADSRRTPIQQPGSGVRIPLDKLNRDAANRENKRWKSTDLKPILILDPAARTHTCTRRGGVRSKIPANRLGRAGLEPATLGLKVRENKLKGTRVLELASQGACALGVPDGRVRRIPRRTR